MTEGLAARKSSPASWAPRRAAPQDSPRAFRTPQEGCAEGIPPAFIQGAEHFAKTIHPSMTARAQTNHPFDGLPQTIDAGAQGILCVAANPCASSPIRAAPRRG